MNCVAIDTSCPVGSVSVARAGIVAACVRFGEHESHMREIARAIDEALSRARLALADLQRIALVSGPGSFTGLRIGMAFVKGLSAATGIPVVTIDSLELMALPLIGGQGLVLPMLDARKEQVYAALYRRSRAAESADAAVSLLKPTVAAPDTLLAGIALLPEFAAHDGPLICTGSGAARYWPQITEQFGRRVRLPDGEPRSPSTEILAVRAASMTPVPDALLPDLEPFYIRASDARLQRLREVDSDG